MSGATAAAAMNVARPPWQRLPWQVAILLLVVAAAANAGTGNRLWLTYSLVGLLAAGVAMLLDAIYRWDLPDRLLWWALVPFAMHYLGGSLSGLHQVGGTNGLYYALPWWDNLVHFLGSAAIGVVCAYVLQPRVPGRRLAAFLAGCVATVAGLAVELYEFTGFLWFGTVDQGYYTNTVLDLYYNGLGAFTGAWLWLRAPPTAPAAPAPAPAPAPGPEPSRPGFQADLRAGPPLRPQP